MNTKNFDKTTCRKIGDEAAYKALRDLVKTASPR